MTRNTVYPTSFSNNNLRSPPDLYSILLLTRLETRNFINYHNPFLVSLSDTNIILKL